MSKNAIFNTFVGKKLRFKKEATITLLIWTSLCLQVAIPGTSRQQVPHFCEELGERFASVDSVWWRLLPLTAKRWLFRCLYETTRPYFHLPNTTEWIRERIVPNSDCWRSSFREKKIACSVCVRISVAFNTSYRIDK